MERGEHRGLHRENELRIAQPRAEVVRHLGERAEERRKDARDRAGDGILRIEEVEARRAVVRVDGDLHGIPDVVHAADGAGVGIA